MIDEARPRSASAAVHARWYPSSLSAVARLAAIAALATGSVTRPATASARSQPGHVPSHRPALERVNDNWVNDTGYINAWSLQF
ncbi:hypothetical protein ACFW5I_34435 [Streptomyces sp. NPDC058818]|uniref:hypothetical protein n=1 Tax=Streptomyces sp. NPDC058818 TaxID=3346640 RepID=UPI0036B7B84A